MPYQFDEREWEGLSSGEAHRRRARDGANELPGSAPRPIGTVIRRIAAEPMFLLLLGCGALYLMLGEMREALMLLLFVIIVMGLTVFQESRSDRALSTLRNLSSPRARVIRDGTARRIAGRDVVTGDLLLLNEGDRIAADGILLHGVTLETDESMLTGESMGVDKRAAVRERPMERPGHGAESFVYAGTVCTRGYGIAKVLATGPRTELGRIGEGIAQNTEPPSGLQRDMGRLIRIAAVIGGGLSLLTAVWYALTRHDWLHGFLSGLTFAMAVLPEEFPVVLTVFLALGGWRLARQQVLARRVPAVEMLGATTVLCLDKTGTLTQNSMTLTTLYTDRMIDIADVQALLPTDAALRQLMENALLASREHPFDPMEKAIHDGYRRGIGPGERLFGGLSLQRTYPLSPDLMAMSHVWAGGEYPKYRIVAKGSPEAILDLCHLPPPHAARLLAETSRMAARGLRILGVAQGEAPGGVLPDLQHDMDYRFCGFVGFEDPIRPDAADSIATCYDAGIRVVMITGDYPETARQIARQAGLRQSDNIVTGSDLAAMDDPTLAAALRQTTLFCRILPEQKLRIVDTLKAQGEIVAMTGDGVNDAPALHSAHIGVAMGERGTDVAREAAALVLLNDNFASLVAAIRQGRRIFDNLRKAVAYIIAVHLPIIALSLVPVLAGLPLVLMPAHILFLQLIIDPVCSLVFESEPSNPEIMRRPPRPADEGLFGTRTLVTGLLQGGVVSAVVLGVDIAALHMGDAPDDARTLTFVTLIVANVALIVTNRSWTMPLRRIVFRPNRPFWLVVASVALVLTAIMASPALRSLFLLTALHPLDWTLALIAGVAGVFWFELFKRYRSF